MSGNVPSLRPSEMSEGGGLLSDVDVVWKTPRFEMFDYEGKSPQPVPALMVDLETADGEEQVQAWSMGSSKDWMPSEDGKTLVSVGDATMLKTNSNGALLIASLINAGFPEEKIGGDASIFEGLECHMIRVTAPERPGLKREKKDGFEQTVLQVSEIHKLPWEAKSGKVPGVTALRLG